MNAAIHRISNESAQEIAINALMFLANDPQRLTDFFRLTGLEPDDLREKAQTPAMMVALLDHLLSDESLLLVFCAATNTEPAEIGPARDALLAQTNC